MDWIPVTFELDGKEIKGHLHAIAGAGGNVWNLMVDKHYWGQLCLVDDRWVFHEQRPKVAHLVDHFAAVVIAWEG
jgi:hypothetical protein